MAIRTAITPLIEFSGTPAYAEIAGGADGTGTLSIPGANTDHLVHCEFSAALAGGLIERQPARITADGVLTVYIHNSTGGALTPAAAVRGVLL